MHVQADPSAVVISTALSAEAPLSSQFTVFAPVDDAVRSGVNSNTSSSEQAQVSFLITPFSPFCCTQPRSFPTVSFFASFAYTVWVVVMLVVFWICGCAIVWVSISDARNSFKAALSACTHLNPVEYVVFLFSN